MILLGDPTEEDMPRGRARAVICDAQCEAPVAIRTGITSQEDNHPVRDSSPRLPANSNVSKIFPYSQAQIIRHRHK